VQALAQAKRGAFELRGGNAAPVPRRYRERSARRLAGNSGGTAGCDMAARPEPNNLGLGRFYFLALVFYALFGPRTELFPPCGLSALANTQSIACGHFVRRTEKSLARALKAAKNTTAFVRTFSIA